jgi:hypothetical protein
MTLPTGGRRMSRAEVIERTRGIAAAVAPQVARVEQLRRMPPENVSAMMGSGLMPLMRPTTDILPDGVDALKAALATERQARQEAEARATGADVTVYGYACVSTGGQSVDA